MAFVTVRTCVHLHDEAGVEAICGQDGDQVRHRAGLEELQLPGAAAHHLVLHLPHRLQPQAGVTAADVLHHRIGARHHCVVLQLQACSKMRLKTWKQSITL
jgi:hypothetical protein